MSIYLENKKHNLAYRLLCVTLLITFGFNVIIPPSYAQVLPGMISLPSPTSMIGVTPLYVPALIKGIEIHPENPLQFNFIIDTGHSKIQGKALEDEATRMVKYFLAALTVPEKELWVNLSPYEKDRVIPETFGKTDMGMDLLAQDYILKQLTASLMYPEKELGDKFWKKVRAQAKKEFGTDDIPMDSFNKVWILPEKAAVYETGNRVFVVNSHLKVLMEQDYLAANAAADSSSLIAHEIHEPSAMSHEQEKRINQIMKEVVIPAIEKEVNEGEHFARLRQINQAAILAKWYKQALKESLLGKVYVDRARTKGIDTPTPEMKEEIYQQYVEAFKKGVYDYIREDYDEQTQEIIPRRYFSGGMGLGQEVAVLGVGAMSESAAANLIRNGMSSQGNIFNSSFTLVENVKPEMEGQLRQAAAVAIASDGAERIDGQEEVILTAADWVQVLREIYTSRDLEKLEFFEKAYVYIDENQSSQMTRERFIKILGLLNPYEFDASKLGAVYFTRFSQGVDAVFNEATGTLYVTDRLVDVAEESIVPTSKLFKIPSWFEPLSLSEQIDAVNDQHGFHLTPADVMTAGPNDSAMLTTEEIFKRIKLDISKGDPIKNERSRQRRSQLIYIISENLNLFDSDEIRGLKAHADINQVIDYFVIKAKDLSGIFGMMEQIIALSFVYDSEDIQDVLQEITQKQDEIQSLVKTLKDMAKKETGDSYSLFKQSFDAIEYVVKELAQFSKSLLSLIKSGRLDRETDEGSQKKRDTLLYIITEMLNIPFLSQEIETMRHDTIEKVIDYFYQSVLENEIFELAEELNTVRQELKISDASIESIRRAAEEVDEFSEMVKKSAREKSFSPEYKNDVEKLLFEMTELFKKLKIAYMDTLSSYRQKKEFGLVMFTESDMLRFAGLDPVPQEDQLSDAHLREMRQLIKDAFIESGIVEVKPDVLEALDRATIDSVLKYFKVRLMGRELLVDAPVKAKKYEEQYGRGGNEWKVVEEADRIFHNQFELMGQFAQIRAGSDRDILNARIKDFMRKSLDAKANLVLAYQNLFNPYDQDGPESKQDSAMLVTPQAQQLLQEVLEMARYLAAEDVDVSSLTGDDLKRLLDSYVAAYLKTKKYDPFFDHMMLSMGQVIFETAMGSALKLKGENGKLVFGEEDFADIDPEKIMRGAVFVKTVDGRGSWAVDTAKLVEPANRVIRIVENRVGESVRPDNAMLTSLFWDVAVASIFAVGVTGVTARVLFLFLSTVKQFEETEILDPARTTHSKRRDHWMNSVEGVLDPEKRKILRRINHPTHVVKYFSKEKDEIQRLMFTYVVRLCQDKREDDINLLFSIFSILLSRNNRFHEYATMYDELGPDLFSSILEIKKMKLQGDSQVTKILDEMQEFLVKRSSMDELSSEKKTGDNAMLAERVVQLYEVLTHINYGHEGLNEYVTRESANRIEAALEEMVIILNSGVEDTKVLIDFLAERNAGAFLRNLENVVLVIQDDTGHIHTSTLSQVVKEFLRILTLTHVVNEKEFAVISLKESESVIVETFINGLREKVLILQNSGNKLIVTKDHPQEDYLQDELEEHLGTEGIRYHFLSNFFIDVNPGTDGTVRISHNIPGQMVKISPVWIYKEGENIISPIYLLKMRKDSAMLADSKGKEDFPVAARDGRIFGIYGEHVGSASFDLSKPQIVQTINEIRSRNRTPVFVQELGGMDISVFLNNLAQQMDPSQRKVVSPEYFMNYIRSDEHYRDFIYQQFVKFHDKYVRRWEQLRQGKQPLRNLGKNQFTDFLYPLEEFLLNQGVDIYVEKVNFDSWIRGSLQYLYRSEAIDAFEAGDIDRAEKFTLMMVSEQVRQQEEREEMFGGFVRELFFEIPDADIFFLRGGLHTSLTRYLENAVYDSRNFHKHQYGVKQKESVYSIALLSELLDGSKALRDISSEDALKVLVSDLLLIYSREKGGEFQDLNKAIVHVVSTRNIAQLQDLAFELQKAQIKEEGYGWWLLKHGGLSEDQKKIFHLKQLEERIKKEEETKAAEELKIQSVTPEKINIFEQRIDTAFGVNPKLGMSLGMIDRRYNSDDLPENLITDLLKKLGFEERDGSWYRVRSRIADLAMLTERADQLYKELTNIGYGHVGINRYVTRESANRIEAALEEMVIILNSGVEDAKVLIDFLAERNAGAFLRNLENVVLVIQDDTGHIHPSTLGETVKEFLSMVKSGSAAHVDRAMLSNAKAQAERKMLERVMNPKFQAEFLYNSGIKTTFAMFKPDALRFQNRENEQKILTELRKYFRVFHGPKVHLSRSQAEEFYHDHVEKDRLLQGVVDQEVIPLFLVSLSGDPIKQLQEIQISLKAQFKAEGEVARYLYASANTADVKREAGMMFDMMNLRKIRSVDWEKIDEVIEDGAEMVSVEVLNKLTISYEKLVLGESQAAIPVIEKIMNNLAVSEDFKNNIQYLYIADLKSVDVVYDEFSNKLIASSSAREKGKIIPVIIPAWMGKLEYNQLKEVRQALAWKPTVIKEANKSGSILLIDEVDKEESAANSPDDVIAEIMTSGKGNDDSGPIDIDSFADSAAPAQTDVIEANDEVKANVDDNESSGLDVELTDTALGLKESEKKDSAMLTSSEIFKIIGLDITGKDPISIFNKSDREKREILVYAIKDFLGVSPHEIRDLLNHATLENVVDYFVIRAKEQSRLADFEVGFHQVQEKDIQPYLLSQARKAEKNLQTFIDHFKAHVKENELNESNASMILVPIRQIRGAMRVLNNAYLNAISAEDAVVSDSDSSALISIVESDKVLEKLKLDLNEQDPLQDQALRKKRDALLYVITGLLNASFQSEEIVIMRSHATIAKTIDYFYYHQMADKIFTLSEDLSRARQRFQQQGGRLLQEHLGAIKVQYEKILELSNEIKERAQQEVVTSGFTSIFNDLFKKLTMEIEALKVPYYDASLYIENQMKLRQDQKPDFPFDQAMLSLLEDFISISSEIADKHDRNQPISHNSLNKILVTLKKIERILSSEQWGAHLMKENLPESVYESLERLLSIQSIMIGERVQKVEIAPEAGRILKLLDSSSDAAMLTQSSANTLAGNLHWVKSVERKNFPEEGDETVQHLFADGSELEIIMPMHEKKGMIKITLWTGVEKFNVSFYHGNLKSFVSDDWVAIIQRIPGWQRKQMREERQEVLSYEGIGSQVLIAEIVSSLEGLLEHNKDFGGNYVMDSVFATKVLIDLSRLEEILKQGGEEAENLRSIAVRENFSDLLMAFKDVTEVRKSENNIRESSSFGQIARKVAELLNAQNVGGIDLNPELFDLQIKRDGKGVPLPLQPVETMHIEGFYPVLINIMPIQSLSMLMGFMDEDVNGSKEPQKTAGRDGMDVLYREEYFDKVELMAYGL